MAYKRIDDAYIRGCMKEYLCDTDADLANLPESCVGSTAVSIESGKVYVVNTKGKWQEFGVPLPTVIEWDGNTEGLTIFELQGTPYYKVSDRFLTEEEIMGAIMTVSGNDYACSYSVMTDGVNSISGSDPSTPWVTYKAYSVKAGSYTVMGGMPLEVSEDGTYFSVDISKITLPNAK